MKKHLIFTISLLILSQQANALKIDTANCKKELEGEPVVYSEDFKWNMSLEEIQKKADELYNSNKRLKERVYFDEIKKSFIFPFNSVQGGAIKIPENFIVAVTKHVEKAFERKYIDALIFPDMGHSHFLVPKKYYDSVLRDLPVNQTNVLYEKIMAHKDIKVVYHTAEQLKTLDDDRNLLKDKAIQWRYYTRNLLGHNNTNPDLEIHNATAESTANTMSEIPGYHWWGGGFNIHANKNGCFTFVKDGKKMYFDLSLKDIEPAPEK
jgi:hypothetical protein